MRWRLCILGLAVGLMGVPSAAWGIYIETPSGKVGGYLERIEGGKLVIKFILPDGKEKLTEYDRSKIKILNEIKKDRLAKLSKDDPKAYRDYAEELAAWKADPEAKDMAMRLYLIAAYLNPQQFGHGSLISMSNLAGTTAESRKCRAMAFLLDPKGDAEVLKRDAVKPAAMPKAQTSALQDFQKALHYYRTGQIKNARDVALRDGMDKVFATVPGMMDRTAFLQRCTDVNCTACKAKGKLQCANCGGRGIVAGPFGGFERCATCNGLKALHCTACDGTGANLNIPDDAMRTILRAELWALEQLAGGDAGDKKVTGETKWSSILQSRQVNPVAVLSLETITEFDPRKCVFRNGAWVVP